MLFIKKKIQNDIKIRSHAPETLRSAAEQKAASI